MSGKPHFAERSLLGQNNLRVEHGEESFKTSKISVLEDDFRKMTEFHEQQSEVAAKFDIVPTFHNVGGLSCIPVISYCTLYIVYCYPTTYLEGVLVINQMENEMN